MTHNVKKILISILLSVMVIFLPACSEKDGSGYLFRYAIFGDPETLDPQIASDTSSLVVIENMFDGLFRFTDSGAISNGMAAEYSISDDGLTYTFKLKNDQFWANSDEKLKIPVTANDFVFAFQRIFDKATHSPYAENFSCIKNAEKIISGELDKTQIAVTALSDFELEIELEYTNANFLSLLASSPAKPCNQEFFEKTKGKYGLETEWTISNGAFFLKQWEYDPYGKNNYLILRKNKYFSDSEKVYPSSLNFFVEKSNSRIPEGFLAGETDCAVFDGSEEKIFDEKYVSKGYETITQCLVYSPKSENFSSQDLRKALTICLNRDEIGNKLPKGVDSAKGIVPPGVTILNKSYRELIAENADTNDTETAKNLWSNQLKSLEKFTIENVKILVPKSFKNADLLKYITQQWQNKLGFFCGIEVVSDKDYYSRIASGDYDIALWELSCPYNSPQAVLDNFRSSSGANISAFSDQEFEEILDQSRRSKNLNDCVKLYGKAEKIIIDSYAVTPVFYQTEYFVCETKYSDIVYNPFTRQVNFSKAKKL
ncbi:MAG: peptide ABC transporter substrate-binding protein [Oscillospiraceae bacterium]